MNAKFQSQEHAFVNFKEKMHLFVCRRKTCMNTFLFWIICEVIILKMHEIYS